MSITVFFKDQKNEDVSITTDYLLAYDTKLQGRPKSLRIQDSRFTNDVPNIDFKDYANVMTRASDASKDSNIIVDLRPVQENNVRQAKVSAAG